MVALKQQNKVNTKNCIFMKTDDLPVMLYELHLDSIRTNSISYGNCENQCY